MKIDVEGTEVEILTNGSRFLDRFHPPILCEVLHGVGDGEALSSLLAPFGYRFYLVTEHTLMSRPAIEPDPRFRDWLLTCQRQEELASFRIPFS